MRQKNEEFISLKKVPTNRHMYCMYHIYSRVCVWVSSHKKLSLIHISEPTRPY